MAKLTEKQICRQEYVDNNIGEMIYNCIDDFFGKDQNSIIQCFVKHDEELSGDIRDVIFRYIEKYDLPITEQEFYPSVEE